MVVVGRERVSSIETRRGTVAVPAAHALSRPPLSEPTHPPPTPPATFPRQTAFVSKLEYAADGLGEDASEPPEPSALLAAKSALGQCEAPDYSESSEGVRERKARQRPRPTDFRSLRPEATPFWVGRAKATLRPSFLLVRECADGRCGPPCPVTSSRRNMATRFLRFGLRCHRGRRSYSSYGVRSQYHGMETRVWHPASPDTSAVGRGV